MKSLWICQGPDGGSLIKPLPLPFRLMKRPIDPEIFRRQARGENVGKPKLFDAKSLRSRRTVGLRSHHGSLVDDPGLVFVISGRVDVSLANGDTYELGPGDVCFQDDCSGAGVASSCIGDCRLLHLSVADGWRPDGELQDPRSQDQCSVEAGHGSEALLRRMYRAADDKSYFREFGELFPSSEEWSEPREVVGFHFVTFPPGYFIDWHPEGVNNFVIVMTGGLELEVSGDGAVEIFKPGNVCLAEDRVGEGHIDRAHGETRMALIVFDDEMLWPAIG